MGLGREVKGLHGFLKAKVGGFCFAESVCFDRGEGFSVLFLLLLDDHHGETAVVGPLTVWQFRGFCFRVLFLLCLLLLFRVIEVEFDIIPVCLYT